jgi:dTDP-4-dehydrorhamnose reductase
MLGHDLQSAAARAGHEVVPLTRAELDIADAGAVSAAVASARPDVVVNSAAWTNVDGAESEEEAATAVNGTGAGNVAEAAAAHGAWTLHVSSDYVFEGTATEPYVESSPTGPLSAYGRSKLAGEHAVIAAAPGAHTIVRSAWLFGVHGPCFPATISRLARERDELTVVADQVGCPTFTGHLADALVEVAETRPLGLLHIAGGGQCSWFQFAQAVVAAAGAHCTVTPGRTEDLGRPAPRPAYSVLRSERLGDAPLLPDWEQGLDDYLEEVTKR